MGCDIHFAIQVLRDNGWESIQWQDAPYNFERETWVPIPDIPIAPAVFSGRNYDLFGILADVRNGTGFAGIVTGDEWPSIAPHRGLPEGFDPEAVTINPKYNEPRWVGEHSFTWATLEELKAYDWDGTAVTHYGVVPAEYYEQLMLEHAYPEFYCGATWGAGVVTYTPEEYEAAKKAGTLAPSPYVRMSWKDENARESTCDWPGIVLPWLESLAAGRPLRLVMGFDS